MKKVPKKYFYTFFNSSRQIQPGGPFLTRKLHLLLLVEDAEILLQGKESKKSKVFHFLILSFILFRKQAVLMEKLKYAIHFCKSIDTDEYARIPIAMGDPSSPTASEDNSDIESVIYIHSTF